MVPGRIKIGIVAHLVIADQHCRIVGGHQRLKVLKDLDLKIAPVVKLSLTKDDFKILNLGLNRINGEWGREKLVPLPEGPRPNWQERVHLRIRPTSVLQDGWGPLWKSGTPLWGCTFAPSTAASQPSGSTLQAERIRRISLHS